MIRRVRPAGVWLAGGVVLLAGCSGSESIEWGGGSAAVPSTAPSLGNALRSALRVAGRHP